MDKLEIKEGFYVGGQFFKTREAAESHKKEKETREQLLAIVAPSHTVSIIAHMLGLPPHIAPRQLNDAALAEHVASVIWKHRKEIFETLAGTFEGPTLADGTEGPAVVYWNIRV